LRRPRSFRDDLWWSGKHKHHGGNIQVISVPDGWPLWTSPVRPGREHDMTCGCPHGIIEALPAVADTLIALADLGYEGVADVLRVPIKNKPGRELTDDQKTYNKLLRGYRASANGPTPCSPSDSKRSTG
jgi:hypothetical protein